jgi:hypothetical protein
MAATGTSRVEVADAWHPSARLLSSGSALGAVTRRAAGAAPERAAWHLFGLTMATGAARDGAIFQLEQRFE